MSQLHHEAAAEERFGFFKKFINLVIPLMLGIVIAFYIADLCSYEIALQLNIDGEPVGLLKSRDGVVRAEYLLEERLTEAAGADYELDCEISYEYTHAKDPVFLSDEDCAELLYSYAAGDFADASVLYIDGEAAAANEDRKALESLIGEIEAEMLASGGDFFSRVVISNNIEIVDQLCQSELLMSIDEINQLINPLAAVTEESAKEEPLPAVTEEKPVLLRVNAFASASPKLLDESAMYNPDIDYGVMRSPAAVDEETDVVLDYTFVNVVTLNETIYHKNIYIDDYDHFVGTNEVISEGSNGQKTVTYELIYNEAGDLIRRNVLNERIISEPVDRIVKKGAVEIPDPVPTGSFIWPCAAPRGISSPYGWRTIYDYTEFHLGIDLPDKKGAPIYASDGGEIVWAGYTPSYGYSIRILHANDYSTVYAHLSKMHVKVGDHVYQGQLIGDMGSTGMSYGPHLHFEVRIGSETRDPEKYLPLLVIPEN